MSDLLNDEIEMSIVIPLYNEEEVFAELTRRLKAVLDGLPFRAEVVLIDDGSCDSTSHLIADACGKDARFRGVVLSRNFGHQAAVTAGMRHAAGRTVAVLDGDLQDPPEVLEDFHRRLNEGFDVVYAVRQGRKENFLKRLAYYAFYRVLRRLATISIPLDSGDFCIMSQRVVRIINSLPERHRFVRGMRSWVGFRQVGCPYDRAGRAGGHSKYSLARLAALALDGIFTFSEKPLRWSSYAGAVVAALAFLWALRTIAWRLLTNESLPGFATMATGMFFLGGVQLLSIGILGEYVGRIHNEVKARPPYVVDRLYGLAPCKSSEAGSHAPGD